MSLTKNIKPNVNEGKGVKTFPAHLYHFLSPPPSVVHPNLGPLVRFSEMSSPPPSATVMAVVTKIASSDSDEEDDYRGVAQMGQEVLPSRQLLNSPAVQDFADRVLAAFGKDKKRPHKAGGGLTPPNPVA